MEDYQMTGLDLAALLRAEAEDVGNVEQLLRRLRLREQPNSYAVRVLRSWFVPAVAGALALMIAVVTFFVVGFHDHAPPRGVHAAAEPLKTYSVEGVASFEYPSPLFTSPGWVSMGGGGVFTYLGSQRLGNPCRTQSNPNGSGEQVCGLSIALPRLAPAGIVITWARGQRPGVSEPPQTVADQMSVGGHAAQLERARANGECSAIGGALQETGTVSHSAALDDPGPRTFISACIGPIGQPLNLAAFGEMLSTVHWMG